VPAMLAARRAASGNRRKREEDRGGSAGPGHSRSLRRHRSRCHELPAEGPRVNCGPHPYSGSLPHWEGSRRYAPYIRNFWLEDRFRYRPPGSHPRWEGSRELRPRRAPLLAPQLCARWVAG
jgi:hypothetical protein